MKNWSLCIAAGVAAIVCVYFLVGCVRPAMRAGWHWGLGRSGTPVSSFGCIAWAICFGGWTVALSGGGPGVQSIERNGLLILSPPLGLVALAGVADAIRYRRRR